MSLVFLFSSLHKAFQQACKQGLFFHKLKGQLAGHEHFTVDKQKPASVSGGFICIKQAVNPDYFLWIAYGFNIR